MAQRDREEAGSRRRRKKEPKSLLPKFPKKEKIADYPPFNNCGGDSSYLDDSS